MLSAYTVLLSLPFVAESEDDAVKQVQNTFDFLSNEDSDDEDEETEWQQVATKVPFTAGGCVTVGVVYL